MSAVGIGPDLDEIVGMTTLAIEIPTGYVVARDAIEAVYNSHVPGLKRVRFSNGVLYTLWESVSNK